MILMSDCTKTMMAGCGHVSVVTLWPYNLLLLRPHDYDVRLWSKIMVSMLWLRNNGEYVYVVCFMIFQLLVYILYIFNHFIDSFSTPDRLQSRTIFYLKVILSRLPNKEFFIAKMTIADRKLDVFDCHNIDFGNRKRCFLAIENENLLKILRSQLLPIRCV